MKQAVLAASVVVVAAGAANADLMIFTDRGAWEAALGGAPIVTEDFNDITPFVFGVGETLDTGNLQITRDGEPNGSDGALEIEPGGNFGTIDGTTFLSGETGVEPHERVEFRFNGASVLAFGADFTSPFSGDGIALSIGGDTVNIDTIAGFGTGFFGVISDSSFDLATIVGTDEPISFQELWSADNVSYAIPAPGAMTLLGLGGLAAARRRR